jgi:CheY-like chemotaxis protein
MPSGLSFSPASSCETRHIARPLRVIVIDDLPDMVLSLLALLRNEGFDVKGFSSGREALNQMQDFDPDVVISDIAMPSVNGWDVAREVRRAMGDARPVLIAISGQYTKGADKALAEAAGFNHYLTKPCDPEVLMSLLKLAPGN